MGQENDIYDILERKNAYLKQKIKKQQVQKVKKLQFFERG